MLSVQEALQRILAEIKPVEKTQVALGFARGRILSAAITAAIDFPPFANSSMDGFAVRARDVARAAPAHPVRLSVKADIPAGAAPVTALQSGQTARIMTGAPLPEGADAVVPIEDTDMYQSAVQSLLGKDVQVFRPAETGQNVRPAGQDIRRGQTVLQAGRRLQPQDLGLLATLGITHPPVFSLPKIALLSTGDELVAPDQPLEPGKIRDSNSYALTALVEKSGGEVILSGIVPDNPEAILDTLESAIAKGADLILTSAGISVGAFDYVRAIVQKHGHLNFWKVNIRPGKPLIFGSYRNIPLLGLPGNPVSSFVVYIVFAHPVIQQMAGLPGQRRPAIKVRLAHPIESDGRESYLRAILDFSKQPATASLTSHQGSGNLLSLVQANALLIVPSGVKSLPTGAELEAWLLEDDF